MVSAYSAMSMQSSRLLALTDQWSSVKAPWCALRSLSEAAAFWQKLAYRHRYESGLNCRCQKGVAWLRLNCMTREVGVAALMLMAQLLGETRP